MVKFVFILRLRIFCNGLLIVLLTEGQRRF
jgi:hypothetical protein